MTEPTITPKTTLNRVLEIYPWAPRALFLLHRISLKGDMRTSSTVTLEEFCRTHALPEVEELIQFFQESEEMAAQMEVSPQFVAEVFKDGPPFRLVDVRTQQEWDLAKIGGATLLTKEMVKEILDNWPKDEVVVFYCHLGQRSLNAAAYFIEQGFANVWSMAGGIDGWSRQVDPSVPCY